MLTKTCTKCQVKKHLDAFSKNSRNKSNGRQPKCKTCNSAYEKENQERVSKRAKLYRERVRGERNRKQKVYRDKRRQEMGDTIREYHTNYYAANKKILNEKQRARYQNEREKWREYSKQYAKNNRAKMNAILSRRKAMQKQAVPSWADFDAIRSFYEKAQAITRETGVEHEVDHIVPIKSRYVCGLHCQQNLQVLTAEENNRKNNSWWPDMP